MPRRYPPEIRRQVVELALDASDLDAAAVLASLPRVRHPNPGMRSHAYGLTWHMNSLAYSAPRPDEPVTLTPDTAFALYQILRLTHRGRPSRLTDLWDALALRFSST